MLICGSFLTTNFTNRTNNCFCWISLNLCEPLEQRCGKILWDFPPTKSKTVRVGSVWALGAKVRKNSVRFPTHQIKNRESGIRVSPWSKGAKKFCEIFHSLMQKPWDPRDLCEPLEQRCGKILWDFPPTKAKTVRSAGSVWGFEFRVWDFRVMWGKIGNLVEKINTDKYETETFIIDDGCYCCSRFCAITDCLS